MGNIKGTKMAHITALSDSPPKTKLPTVEMNPERKELKGNVPTKQQYKNWIIPVTNIYPR